VLVALDYAYWEYVTAKDFPDAYSLMRKYPNVVVLRTFSKVYGLAGLRVGYGVGDESLIEMLHKVRQPFNVSSMGLIGAVAALDDKSFVKKSVEMNKKGMSYWERGLSSLNIPYWPSQGNFILADVQRGLGKRGGDVYNNCLKKGVIFRPVANYGLQGALRISVGTTEENVRAFRALEAEHPDFGKSHSKLKPKKTIRTAKK
jgi:histidinol-phosphate aminotransferase